VWGGGIAKENDTGDLGVSTKRYVQNANNLLQDVSRPRIRRRGGLYRGERITKRGLLAIQAAARLVGNSSSRQKMINKEEHGGRKFLRGLETQKGGWV